MHSPLLQSSLGYHTDLVVQTKRTDVGKRPKRVLEACLKFLESRGVECGLGRTRKLLVGTCFPGSHRLLEHGGRIISSQSRAGTHSSLKWGPLQNYCLLSVKTCISSLNYKSLSFSICIKLPLLLTTHDCGKS